MALLAALLLACCLLALPVHGQDATCVITKGTGSPGVAPTYISDTSQTVLGEAQIVTAPNGFKIVAPITGNTTYQMLAVDVTQPDGANGFDAWAANYCTAAPNLPSNVAYNLNTDPSNGVGAVFLLSALGLPTLCNQPQPRYLATSIIVTTPEVREGSLHHTYSALQLVAVSCHAPAIVQQNVLSTGHMQHGVIK